MSGFNHLFKLYVSGSTIWLCFPPRWTLAIIYPITILVFVIYGILNHGPLKKYQENLHNNTSHKYERVSSSPNNDSNSDKSRNSYWIKQVQFFFDVLPYFGYLFATFCSFHIAISSVLTTLSFPSSPFRIRRSLPLLQAKQRRWIDLGWIRDIDGILFLPQMVGLLSYSKAMDSRTLKCRSSGVFSSLLLGIILCQMWMFCYYFVPLMALFSVRQQFKSLSLLLRSFKIHTRKV